MLISSRVWCDVLGLIVTKACVLLAILSEKLHQSFIQRNVIAETVPSGSGV